MPRPLALTGITIHTKTFYIKWQNEKIQTAKVDLKQEEWELGLKFSVLSVQCLVQKEVSGEWSWHFWTFGRGRYRPEVVIPSFHFQLWLTTLALNLTCQLTMADHVAALSRSCFFNLLWSVKQALTPDATRTPTLMFLFADGWTTVTAYLLVPVVHCYRQNI